MAIRKPTPMQSAWDKEIKRLQRQLNKYARQGFSFDFDLPTRPTRVTKKQLSLIKSAKIEFAGKKRDYYDTDEEARKVVISYQEQRKGSNRVKHEQIRPSTGRLPPTLTKEQRSKAAKKAAQTRKAYWKRHPEEYEEYKKEFLKRMREGKEKRKTKETVKKPKIEIDEQNKDYEEYVQNRNQQLEELKQKAKEAKEKKQKEEMDKLNEGLMETPDDGERETSFDIIISKFAQSIDSMHINQVTRDTLSSIFSTELLDDKDSVGKSLQEFDDTNIKDAAFEADNPSNDKEAMNGARHLLEMAGLATPFNLEAIQKAIEIDFQLRYEDRMRYYRNQR